MSEGRIASGPTVYPLVWCDDVRAIVEWARAALGVAVVWKSPDDHDTPIEHAELAWNGGRISLNVRADAYADTGPAGIALAVATRDQVDAAHSLAVAHGAEIIQGPEDSFVAYSFTARDPDGNQWWVHAETGNLDGLRS